MILSVPRGIKTWGLSMSHRLNYEATALTTRPPWPEGLDLLSVTVLQICSLIQAAQQLKSSPVALSTCALHFI